MFWERGSPDLPACSLRRGSSGGSARPIFISSSSKTLARGQASRGGRQDASLEAASSGRLARRRRDQGGVPHEVSRDASHDDQRRQAGASRAVSSFPLWCKGSKRTREHQAKAPVSVQRDQDQSNGREEVIVEPKPASPPEPLAGEDQR